MRGHEYDFRLSNRILRPEIQRAIDIDSSNLEAQKLLCVNLGEAVYVMTEEELEMPANMFCQLSLKRKLSHEGIIVLGGFTIDPKYKGRLIFGLYNISSERYTLKPGRKLVAGIFSKIGENDLIDDIETPEAIYDFPEKLEDWVKNFKPLSPEALSNEVSELRANVKLLYDKLEKDDTWRKDFREGLEGLQTKIDQIAEKLSSEIDTRKDGTSGLRISLARLKTVGTIISCLLSIIGTLLVLWLTGLLNISS